MMGSSWPFWNADLTNAEALIRQTILSRVITAKHGARLMVRDRRGLIVQVTENDLLLSSGDVITQLARVSHKALSVTCAEELRQHGVAAITITPGFLRSERMLEYFGVTENNWQDAGQKDRNFLESESPLFVGRAIVALATDPAILDRTGQLFSSWEVAREYGVTDADGRRPDWGRLDIDYSQVPQSWIDVMRDGLPIQIAWLQRLLDRTRNFQAAFRNQTTRIS